ncbi:MAG: hypothetical protein ACOYUZ_04170 [Patescibacteria group bacterium]
MSEKLFEPVNPNEEEMADTLPKNAAAEIPEYDVLPSAEPNGEIEPPTQYNWPESDIPTGFEATGDAGGWAWGNEVAPLRRQDWDKETKMRQEQEMTAESSSSMPPREYDAEETLRSAAEDMPESSIREKTAGETGRRGTVPRGQETKAEEIYPMKELPEGFRLSETPEWDIGVRGTIESRGDENRPPYAHSVAEEEAPETRRAA